MSGHENTTNTTNTASSAASAPATTSSSQPSSSSSWAPSVPAPIKRVFDRFPLAVYPADALPARCHRRSDETNVLYVFTDARGAARGCPSFNPQCLKWQAYLKFSGVDFRTARSTNHAAPSGGALPFLLPAHSLSPIPASKLRTWAGRQSPQSRGLTHAEQEPEPDSRHEPYMALLDHRIRRAWLYTLYVHDANFSAVARRQYIEPTTSNSLVRLALAQQLRRSARHELLKAASTGGGATGSTSAFIDVDDILAEADRAFEALSTLLGEDAYFFGAEEPGLFDAAVFAYTHLMLDDGMMGWAENVLGRYVRRYANLVEHRERIKRGYFPNV